LAWHQYKRIILYIRTSELAAMFSLACNSSDANDMDKDKVNAWTVN